MSKTLGAIAGLIALVIFVFGVLVTYHSLQPATVYVEEPKTRTITMYETLYSEKCVSHVRTIIHPDNSTTYFTATACRYEPHTVEKTYGFTWHEYREEKKLVYYPFITIMGVMLMISALILFVAVSRFYRQL